MLEKLQNKKAEGYIDVAVAVLVIVFLLVFFCRHFFKNCREARPFAYVSRACGGRNDKRPYRS